MTVKPPKYVKESLRTLEERGFRAFLVGGCVRDLFLGRSPQDWDVATDATPEQVMALFENTIPTGIRHGTVTVLLGKGAVEVTTFRREEDYSDHRRPGAVRYISDLHEDLSRRDFTMNAIAIPLHGIMIDPYGGRADIEKKQIRCVGEAEARFTEDALRMLRAMRFSAKLGFAVTEETRMAIDACAYLAAHLSAERVRDEVEKILLSDRPEVIWEVLQAGLLDRFLIKRPARVPADPKALGRAENHKFQRWAALCAQLLDMGLISTADGFLKALRLDGKTISHIRLGVEMEKCGLPEDRQGWKTLLWRYGVQPVLCAAAAADALEDGGYGKAVKAVLKSGECFSLKRLAVNGDDLIGLGYHPGPQVGKALEALLAHVIRCPADNKKHTLIARAAYLLTGD